MRVVFGANLDLDPHDPGDLRRHNSQQERIAQIAAIRKVIGTSQESVVLTR